MDVRMDTRALEKKLKRIEGGADQMALDIVNRLTGKGAELSTLYAPVDSGELHGSVRSVPAALNRGIAEGAWATNSDHAPYVEYGTGKPGAAGQIGNGQPRLPEAAGFAYTLETVIQSGPRAGRTQKGWVYFDEKLQRFIHTLGQPAQPFMYPAVLQVQQEAGMEAAEVVRNTLKG